MAVNVAKIRGNGLYLINHEEAERKNPSPVSELLEARFWGRGAEVLGISGRVVTRSAGTEVSVLVLAAADVLEARGGALGAGLHAGGEGLALAGEKEVRRDAAESHARAELA